MLFKCFHELHLFAYYVNLLHKFTQYAMLSMQDFNFCVL